MSKVGFLFPLRLASPLEQDEPHLLRCARRSFFSRVTLAHGVPVGSGMGTTSKITPNVDLHIFTCTQGNRVLCPRERGYHEVE